jgi:phosphatidylserine/phosphatidylglycerophosphate/cardiolipin synthase-like enzyme
MLASAGALAAGPTLQLIQTWPVEVETLRSPAHPDAHVAWLEMIESAERTLELSHFYASTQPGSRLEPVIEAIEAAAARGVTVRFLAARNFHRTYPETLDQLGSVAGIEVRLYDTKETMGGVLHNKYMIVDGKDAVLGSQNFDWRSLEHILELGVRIRSAALVTDLRDVFEYDWALAGGEQVPGARGDAKWQDLTDLHGRARFVASPTGYLPHESSWDLPLLLGAIDAAEERVRLQFLSYDPIDRRTGFWPDLDNALRAAAARGVSVELLVSHWNQRRGRIEALKSLQCMEGIEVRILTVPEHSGGFIPFARVTHSKILVCDGRWSWVGTSNASRDYFFSSRNVGLVVEGEEFASQVEQFFERAWGFEGSRTVDPGADYPAPRVGE